MGAEVLPMTSELDQLVSRAANDSSFADPMLTHAIVKAIETTRRHWKALADERLGGQAMPPLGRRTDDDAESE
jgi:hypothetical protein